MTRHRSSPIDNRAKQRRRAARRQALAAVFLTACSLLSPAPDLRPKPLLPVRYQLVKPSDPPGPGSDRFVSAPARTAGDTGTNFADAEALARAGLPPWHPFRGKESKLRHLAVSTSWPHRSG